MFNADLVKSLACPLCLNGFNVLDVSKDTKGNIDSAELICLGESSHRFRIIDGIPRLLPPDISKRLGEDWFRKQQTGKEEYMGYDPNKRKYEDYIAMEYGRWCGFQAGVIDVGCGVGSMPKYMECVPDAAYVGIDPLLGHIPKDFQFVQAVGECLPFFDGSFDMCTLTSVLDHVPYPNALIAEADRVVGSKGRVMILVGMFDRKLLVFRALKLLSRNGPIDFTRRMWRFLRISLGIGKHRCCGVQGKEDKFHFFRFKKADIIKIVKKSGMEVEREKTVDNVLFMELRRA